jgi:hypothetical protein
LSNVAAQALIELHLAALTKLNIAVFAPMPRASVATATAVKPGFFANIRNP